MQRIIVTPGNAYSDIDGLACAIAYAELLRSEGKDAIAVCSGPLNSTVPDSLRMIAKHYSHKDLKGDEYVLVDVSDKNFIEPYIPLHQVIAIFDHHFGFEDFWREKLGENSKIEPIGAAATLIWEEWKNRGKQDTISEESATLLAHAILSNTVNFQLSLTCDRDRGSLYELERYLRLESGWKEMYFMAQQNHIMKDPIGAIKNDIKEIRGFEFGQLEIWDSSEFLASTDFDELFHTMGYKNWIINIVDISRGTSVISSNQENYLDAISVDTQVPAIRNIISLPKLMLRKELLRIINANA